MVADQRMVFIVWKDEPERPISTWVMVGKKWTEEDEHGKFFEYFATEDDYQKAKNKDNTELDYWIVDSTTIHEKLTRQEA